MAKVSSVTTTSPEPVALMEKGASEQAVDLQRDVSLFVLISQAVASKDATLLERVFQVQDHKMTESAVLQITDSLVLYDLLDAALVRLQRRPMRAPFLMPWLRSILRIHSVALIKAGRCKSRLAPLMRLAAARSKSWRRMMTLRGRLDLICAHHAVDHTEEAVMVPSVVYNFDAHYDDDDEDELVSEQQYAHDDGHSSSSSSSSSSTTFASDMEDDGGSSSESEIDVE